MAIFEDEAKKPARSHEIGQDLATLSLAELKHRITLLQGEITRIETELAAKGSTQAAAEALFRR